ncbi:hypothetical protein [Oleiharenicola lentus]|uniref:hypothetical protein n=1 Tax=Oleiharenicola lentus TaxID=2508720 RepID=UPI003F663D15
MPSFFPPCPHLPAPPDKMDAGALSAHGPARDADFYFTALTYGHYLWQSGFAARAVLSLDRALGADLQGNEAVLRDWPLPYAAQVWFLGHTPKDVFIGNPRVHFQHLADRMNEPRREQRRWRIWACWGLSRVVLPNLPDDPKHAVREPTFAEISANLDRYGIPGERALWESVIAIARASFTPSDSTS